MPTLPAGEPRRHHPRGYTMGTHRQH